MSNHATTTFLIFEVARVGHRIVKTTKKSGRASKLKKASLERDYIRNTHIVPDCYVLALRHDLARCYLTKINGDYYIDVDMVKWYPPNQKGAKPKSFYARKPPGSPVDINYTALTTDLRTIEPSIACPHCGCTLDLTIKKK